jgi:hypothetical protein
MKNKVLIGIVAGVVAVGAIVGGVSYLDINTLRRLMKL